MRLFVALEIPEPVRREVRRRVAGLRERLPRARWVDPDVLHLTLLFLGEVAPELVAELAGRLGQAFAAHPALPLRLTGGGTFPAGRPARVAWIGVAGPPELAPLQAAVVRAAREALELREAGERPYQPHVTLARCPSPWPRGAAEKFAAAFPAEIGPPFVADRGVLVESRLSPRGPRYRHLAELPLAAAPGEEPGVGSEPGAEEERGSGRNASAEEPDSGKAGSAGERSA
ncbi:MAG TPA: RNA 2',3'-cyclic phosphodiesterase [Thermoanaerobaculia bacterium]|jgi:2'-5' RNA ligase|nr:RNA 2',3'-cyclic phosphodiesterase [Thermoanaerobaculia bacterium]